MGTSLRSTPTHLLSLGFSTGKNKEDGINHGLVTFLNRSFRSQDVSGLGFSGKVVHAQGLGVHLALEKQPEFES